MSEVNLHFKELPGEKNIWIIDNTTNIKVNKGKLNYEDKPNLNRRESYRVTYLLSRYLGFSIDMEIII